MGSTVATVGAIGLAGALAFGLAAVGGAAAEGQRAAGVADAAALAAADVLAGFASGEPCARAAEVAAAQRARLSSCAVTGLTATVEIVVTFARIPVPAAARAGPPP